MKLARWMVVAACVLAAGLLPSACQVGGSAYDEQRDGGVGAGEIRGTVNSRGGVLLMPGTLVRVQLVDATSADGRDRVISEQTINEPRNVPVDFVLRYDPARIDPRRRYGVQARVEVDGQLRWVNATPRPVLSGGDAGKSVDVWVEPVGSR